MSKVAGKIGSELSEVAEVGHDKLCFNEKKIPVGKEKNYFYYFSNLIFFFLLTLVEFYLLSHCIHRIIKELISVKRQFIFHFLGT